MAEIVGEPVEDHHLVDIITDPRLDWVGPEPRGIASVITPTAGRVYTIVEDTKEGQQQNWDVYCLTAEKRVCSEFSDDGFAMYEFAFKELGFRFPFSDLAAGVFGWLKLAPSQLHPNSLAFIRAFEIVCEYLEDEPYLPLFFRIFKLQRQPSKSGHDWVSLKQQTKLFKMFVDSVSGFKERYYVVRPRTPSAKDSLYETTVVTEEDGSTRLDEDGRPVVRRIARFPLSWSEEHFATSTDSYLTKDEARSDGERVGLAKLQSFVEKFEPARYVTRAGTPTLDSQGRSRVELRYINTKSLLECNG
ncbi:hypothetical protein A2U01_0006711 [Trifolium medium]|uniref:Transposase (putative) gypsy type domain-containing protein n=1 Tax=Trifolium medium TaxID=97028 RepID=A0A392MFN5_9FABA|nr:hypothetical protein [Trifolium medium]